MVAGDRLAYELEIKELKEKQATLWQNGLPAFIAMRACHLGLCVVHETWDLVSRTHEDPDRRESARRKLDKERGERELLWNRYAREIEQIEIAIAVLRERRDGSL